MSAIRSFEEAVRLKPKDLSAQLGLAQAYYRSGSAKRAIAPLETIVKEQPGTAIAWYYLGKMYGDARQSDKALQAMQRAVDLNPKEATYWRDLAQLSKHYSRLEDAEKQLVKAVELNPQDATAHYWLGQLYLRMGPEPAVQQKAEKHLKEAIRLDPTMPDAHFELGQVYEARRDWATAASHYSKARELAPSYARPLYHLGTCLVRLGRREEGEKLIAAFKELTAAKQELEGLENRAKAEPQNPAIHLRLARAYRKYGNDDGALTLYDVYLRLAPNDEVVRQEMSALRKAADGASSVERGASSVERGASSVERGASSVERPAGAPR